MNRSRLAPLVILGSVLFSACATISSAAAPPRTVQSAPVDADQLRTQAQALVNAFAVEIARVRGGQRAAAPTVDVRNTRS